MRKLLSLILLLVPSLLLAQSSGAPVFQWGGNITAANASCVLGSCVQINLPDTAASMSVTITGTWSATLQLEKSADNGTTWTSSSSTTSNGVTTLAVSSFTNFRVRASALVSGNAGVYFNASTAILSSGGGLSGMTAGQVPIAATASTVTSSKALVGTDAGIASAGTISTTPTISCSDANGGITTSGCPSTSSLTIDAAQYGVVADSQMVSDASWTNGANPLAVTISATDGPFVTADTGKSCFGTSAGTYGMAAIGTFTFVSATTGTCSGTAIGSPSSTGYFVWGHDDTTALLAATTALYNLPACGTLQLPMGYMILTKGIGNTIPNRCGIVANGFAGAIRGPTITGTGQSTTVIIPAQGFDFTTCNTGGCFWNGTALTAAGGHYKSFSIHGANAKLSGISTSPANTLFTVPLSGTSMDLGFFNWAYSASNTPEAFEASNGQAGYNFGIMVSSFGNSRIKCANSTSMTGGSWSSVGLDVPVNNSCYDYGGTYGVGSPTGVNLIAVTGTFYGYGTFTNDDTSLPASSAGLALIGGTGKAYLYGAHIGCFGSAGAGSVGVSMGTGSLLVSEGSCIGGATAITGSGGTFVEGAGTTITQGTVTYTGTYQLRGPQAITGKGTGVCTASQTLFLFPAGQIGASSCTGIAETPLTSPVVITAGNLYNLRCTSSAGGVNASSGVVTVRKNASNTALTATFGTGTTAFDSTLAHIVAVVPGDIITYQITTQAVETLANVACQVEVQ